MDPTPNDQMHMSQRFILDRSQMRIWMKLERWRPYRGSGVFSHRDGATSTAEEEAEF